MATSIQAIRKNGNQTIKQAENKNHATRQSGNQAKSKHSHAINNKKLG
jgi:hypothetical protein